MKKILSLSLTTLAMAAMAAPAFAQDRAVIVLTPGSSSNWEQDQPTHFLATDMAQVLPDDKTYLETGVGAGLGGFGPAVTYRLGLENRSELGVGVGLGLNTGAATTFNAGVNASYKQQFSHSDNMAVAGLIALGLSSLPTAGAANTTAFAGQLALPLTFGAGTGNLIVEPELNFPALNAGLGGSTGAVSVGYIAPIADRFQLLVDATPSFGLQGGGFTLPVGIGTRFSPTATSHVDFALGQLQVTPAFTAGLGLVNVVGYIGF